MARTTGTTVSRRARSRSDRDRGVTFIEIVVTIAMLGLVIVPILAAVQVSIRSSTTATDAAELETLLVNAIDRINRADRSVYRCDLSGPPTAAVETAGWPATQLIVSQEYLDVATNSWVGGECPGSPPAFEKGLVQRVTLTLTHPERSITRTLQVVKSDV